MAGAAANAAANTHGMTVTPPDWRQSRPQGRGSGRASERLEVLTGGEALVLAQVVAAGRAAVALPRPGRVIHLAPLELGQVRGRRLLQHRHRPAEPRRVVVVRAGAVGPGE